MGKVDRLIDMFRGHMGGARPPAGEAEHAHYYIAYLSQVAKAVSREERVDYSPQVEAMVLAEASRLCGRRDGEAHEGERLLPGILSTEYGKRGTADGRLDGEHAIDESSEGPYFVRIKAYFEP